MSSNENFASDDGLGNTTAVEMVAIQEQNTESNPEAAYREGDADFAAHANIY